jgi:hypothetical protein
MSAQRRLSREERDDDSDPGVSHSESEQSDGRVEQDPSDGEQPDQSKEEQNAAPEKKKRGAPIPRTFVEVNRWSLDDFTEQQVKKFIADYLDELEEAGGGFEGLVRHADRTDRYGGFTYRRTSSGT